MIKIIKDYIHKHSISLSVTVICIYALFLRLAVLYRHTLWIDEIYYLGPLKGTFLEFIKAIPKAEFCSYLSGDLFIFYPFFKIFAYNKWGLAIPCVISSILGFYLLFLICKRYLRSIWAYLITFAIVAFNATLINHATEIRTYIFLPTLALAIFYVCLRIADVNFQPVALKRAGVILTFIFVIWFHVYGIIMFIVSFLFALLSKIKDEDSGNYLKNAFSLVFVTLCFSMPFWLYCVFGPHLSYTELGINTFDYIPNPSQNIVGFLKSIFGNLIGYKKLYFMLLGIFVPFIFSYKDRYRQLLFFVIIIMLPIGLILASDVLQKYWFIQRQFIWVMPLFAFFLGWTWDSFFALLKQRFIKK
jgi:hypothetical protein